MHHKCVRVAVFQHEVNQADKISRLAASTGASCRALARRSLKTAMLSCSHMSNAILAG